MIFVSTPRALPVKCLMLRLDQAMVERGLCESRERAKRTILAGQVRINSQLAHKPSDSVSPTDEIIVEAAEKFVSRGGYKLEHALDYFKLDVTGLVAIDVGASTGGFTDCLLQRGAKKVFAVDVGQGQLAWKLRQDKRVKVMEKTNARYLKPEHLAEPPDLAVIDCSFISLRKILPPAAALLKSQARIVALVKPQFEAGKEEADKGRGVIKDASIHERILAELREFVTARQNLIWQGVVESPLQGPAGNKEFLVLIEKTKTGKPDNQI
jgi:23S rRNA (cytidine1920-2'-O)/16S rRNA (cytidine1409-2'-O)-methyltransferase